MKTVFMALAAVILTASSAPASTYYFAFTGSLGTVTGEVDGLSPGYTGPASDVFIDSAPAQFLLTPTPVRFFTTDPTHNNFVVDAAGNVTSFDLFAQFQIYNILNLSSDCLACSNPDCLLCTFNDLETDTLDGVIADTAVSFPTFSTTPPTATPIPNSAVLFATILALAALFICRREIGIRTKLEIAHKFA
jgi:hypothetical protein